MLIIKDFTLSSAIIHRLNNQTDDGLELSAYTLDLEKDFKDILEEHCKKASTDKKIRYTKYNDVTENNIYTETSQFTKGEEAFITYSHKIAKRLYSYMTNKAISAGDLLVADISINSERHIALLKLDYKDQYLSKVEIVEGKKKISLERKNNAWPEAGTRLQKAAFLRANLDLEDNKKYDVIMLDRQNRQNGVDNQSASLFFSKSFLNITLIEDSDTNTIAFIKGAQEISKEFASLNITAEKAQEIYDYAIQQVIKTDKINVEHFTNLFFDKENGCEEEHATIKNIFSEVGLKRVEFEKSPEIAKRYDNKRKIALKGVRLFIENNIYEDPDRFKFKIYDNSANIRLADITIKGLEIKDWE